MSLSIDRREIMVETTKASPRGGNRRAHGTEGVTSMQAQPTSKAVGSKVRFTAGQLGLIRDVNATRFEPEVVHAGDEGIYEGVHPTLSEEGWHVIRVGDLYCPCYRGQFEFIEAQP